MRTILIILNLAGGQPITLSYPSAPACETAKAIAMAETETGGPLSKIRYACIPG